MSVAVLLLAAGSGKRFGGDIPKQYVSVAGQAILLHTLRSLEHDPRISMVQTVIASDDDRFEAVVANHTFSFELLAPVHGGSERSISMQNGLNALPDGVDMVAVHDAARPMTSPAVLNDVLDVAMQYGAAIPAVAVHDTIKRVDECGQVMETPDRACLRAVQTPQVARLDWFRAALEKESDRLHLHTDDASVLEAAGFPVYVSQGDVNNRKITTQHDLQWMQDFLEAKA